MLQASTYDCVFGSGGPRVSASKGTCCFPASHRDSARTGDFQGTQFSWANLTTHQQVGNGYSQRRRLRHQTCTPCSGRGSPRWTDTPWAELWSPPELPHRTLWNWIGSGVHPPVGQGMCPCSWARLDQELHRPAATTWTHFEHPWAGWGGRVLSATWSATLNPCWTGSLHPHTEQRPGLARHLEMDLC